MLRHELPPSTSMPFILESIGSQVRGPRTFPVTWVRLGLGTTQPRPCVRRAPWDAGSVRLGSGRSGCMDVD